MDISGEAQRDLSHNILKIRLDASGSEIPNSYNSELKNDLQTKNAEMEGVKAELMRTKKA